MKKKTLVDKPLHFGARPSISVILPVFNAEKYISESIESVLSQTFSDFELIVIDDGSTDGTYAILNSYLAKDKRIRLITRENKGLIATLNEGVDVSKSEWIARMDADDIALPDRFEQQVEAIRQTGVDICGGWVKRFGTADNRIVKLQQTDNAIKKEMLFCSPFAHPTIMIRSRLLKQLRYNEAWKNAEDYDLWERAIESGCKMINIPKVLLLYRVHPGQVSIKSANFQQEQGQKIRRRYWMFVFKSMGLNTNVIDEALKIFISPLPKVDIAIINKTFTELLNKCDEESRNVIFPHITKFYIRLAASYPGIAGRWALLNDKFGSNLGVTTKVTFWIFQAFQIKENGFVFKLLKKLYIWYGRAK